MSSGTVLIDTVRRFETPEGVALDIRVAGPLVRSLAWTIDVGVRFAIYTAAATVLGILGQAGAGLLSILVFVTEWFYPVLFELLWAGQTPGKRAMGIAVVHDNGTPVGLAASVIRNLLRFADFLPAAYAFGLATMLVHKDFKRLGDMAAGTLVVYREPPLPAAEPPLSQATPLTQALGVEEQRALIDFARRRATWTDDRAAELADILGPLTRDSGATGVRRLLGHASWLLGRR